MACILSMLALCTPTIFAEVTIKNCKASNGVFFFAWSLDASGTSGGCFGNDLQKTLLGHPETGCAAPTQFKCIEQSSGDLTYTFNDVVFCGNGGLEDVLAFQFGNQVLGVMCSNP